MTDRDPLERLIGIVGMRRLIKEKRIYRCNDETPLPW